MSRRQIFSQEFWRTFWVALRRSRRDRRDLKLVLRLTATVLAFVLYYGYLIWTARAGFDQGTLFIILGAIFFVVTALVVRWMANKLDERQSRKESDLATNKTLRNRLASDGFALSVLLSRAGSEQMLREKILPPGIEVVTRRFHIDQLRKLDQWDQLPARVRDSLLFPDGHWPQELIISLRRSFEVLRCIRWVLRIDQTLQPLTHFPAMNYKAGEELIGKPDRLFASVGMLETWDIRIERNNADVFFSRCYAEAIGRGMINNDDKSTKSWAIDVYDSARNLETRDMLVGYETVGELSEATLRYIMETAFHRYTTLQLIIDLAEGADRWEEWTDLCFPLCISAEPEASK